MAVVTRSLIERYGQLPALVPPAILQSIDQTELLDRLAHAEDLMKRAQSTDAREIADGYAKNAGAVLRAQPRAATETKTRGLLKKASGMPWPHNDRIRQQAETILAENPAAPRRPILKAAADSDVVAIYDAGGNLVGTVRADKITPLVPAKAPEPPKPAEPAPADPSDVTKSRLPYNIVQRRR